MDFNQPLIEEAAMSVRTLLWDRIAMLAAALLLAVQFSSAQTFTVLHDFTGGSDGSGPQAGLTLLDTSNLFGSAGDYTLFRMQQRGPSWIFNPIFDAVV